MKNLIAYFKCALIASVFFTSCTHDVPEVDDPIIPGKDTVWSILPSNARDTSVVYYHNDIEKIMITKCAVDGYTNSKGSIGCHSNPKALNGVILDDYSHVREEVSDDFDPADSDLFKVFSETGEDYMPQVGNISQDEIFSIRDWISQGAQDNMCNPCNDYSQGSFRNSVAVILYNNCSGCHNDRSKQGNFSIFRADPNGPTNIDTTAVKISSGLILESIVGIKRGRMPKYIDPLFECEFEAIKKWVDNGMIID